MDKYFPSVSGLRILRVVTVRRFVAYMNESGFGNKHVKLHTLGKKREREREQGRKRKSKKTHCIYILGLHIFIVVRMKKVENNKHKSKIQTV